MKKFIYSSVIIFQFVFCTYSQNPNWILPPKFVENIPFNNFTDLNINNTVNIMGGPPNYQGQIAEFAANSISNLDGSLKFFCIDGYIYDQSGKYLDYVWNDNPPFTIDINGHRVYTGNGGSDIVIVPHPQNCNQYYIFGMEVQGSISGESVFQESNPRYALYDHCSQQILQRGYWFGPTGSSSIFNPQTPFGQYGDVVPISLSAWGAESHHNGVLGITASKKQEDESRFVIAEMRTHFYVIKIHSNGELSYWKSIEKSEYPTGQYRTELELVQDDITGNFLIGSACPVDGAYNVNIMQFNSNFSSQIGLPINFQLQNDNADVPAMVHGLEFSPNLSKLYFTATYNDLYPHKLYYIDLLGTPSLNYLALNDRPIDFSFVEKGTNNKLYFATSSGLYELSDPENPSAANFSSAPIINFQFSYNTASNDPNVFVGSSIAHVLPDQVDGENYFTMIAPTAQCCLSNRNYDLEMFSVTSHQTWSPGSTTEFSTSLENVLYVRDELRVKAGKILALNNLEIHFAPGARLVVESSTSIEKGARLILNNTKLTNDNRCGTNQLWLGVEVWGNQNEIQSLATNNRQGQLFLNDGAVIENAQIGVLVGKRLGAYSDGNINDGCGTTDIDYNQFGYPNSWDNSKAGGIVIANNGIATFINNKRDIHFKPYMGGPSAALAPNNLSQFRKTKFIWNNDVLSSVQDHVRLETVKGVSFTGCYFANEITPGENYFQTGIGINASDAQFYVQPICDAVVSIGEPCPSPYLAPNIFKDMRYGILATNTNGLSFTCNNSQFIRNGLGIYVQGTKLEKITNNEFEIREAPSQTAGLVLFSSSDFKVENNKFYDDVLNPLPSGTPQSYGIVVYNSGATHNEIYRNEFKDLFIGTQVEGINAVDVNSSNQPGGNFLMSGLQLKCNNMTSNILKNDFSLYRKNNNEGRIHFYQGLSTGGISALDQARKTALNKFSLENESGAHDFFVNTDCQSFTYSYINAPGHVPDSYTGVNIQNGQLTTCINIDDALWAGTLITSEANTCPSKLTPKIPSLAISASNQIKQQLVELEGKIDGGSTANLLSLIGSGSSGTVKNTLLAASPYLSDKVLLAYIQSNPPIGNLKQVTLANSPVSNEVLTALSLLNLPNGTFNQILLAQTNSNSPITELNIAKIFLNDELSSIYIERIQEALLIEDTTSNLEPLITILKESDDVFRLELLMKLFTTIRDTTKYQEARVDYVSLEDHCPFYLELSDIKEDVCSQSPLNMAIQEDSTFNAAVTYLRDNSTNIAVAFDANCILKSEEEIIDFPWFATENMGMMLQTTSENPSNYELLPVISIYPNPSTGLVYFDYPTYEEGTLQIEVFDYMGKQVHSQILGSDTNGEAVNLSQLHKGLYLVRVSLDNTILETKHLILE